MKSSADLFDVVIAERKAKQKLKKGGVKGCAIA